MRSRVTAIIESSLGDGAGGAGSNNRQQQLPQSATSSPRPQNIATGSPRGFGSPAQSNHSSPRPHSCLGSPQPSNMAGSPKPSSCVSSPRPHTSSLSSPRPHTSSLSSPRPHTSSLSSPRPHTSSLSSPRLVSSGSPRSRQQQAPQFDMFSGGQQVNHRKNSFYFLSIPLASSHVVEVLAALDINLRTSRPPLLIQLHYQRGTGCQVRTKQFSALQHH